MQSSGIGPGLVRLVAPPGTIGMVGELFTPGRVLEADVISVFENRAMLALGRGLRLEVALQTEVKEGQRLRLQVQPRTGTPGGEGEGRPVVLKLLGVAPRAVAETTVSRGGPLPEPAPAPAPPETPAGATASPDADGSPALAPPALLTPRTAQAVTAQVLWLPIHLPQGGQAWAQLAVQEEPGRAEQAEAAPPANQIRIWWETPALGPIQVTLDVRANALTGLFTAVAEKTQSALEAGLPDLQRRLAAAGFPDARLGSRQSLPGEALRPVIPGEPVGRLDRRI